MAKEEDHARDFMSLGPQVGEGQYTYVRHRPDCTIETGIIVKSDPKSGTDESPGGEMVVLTNQRGNTFDVETFGAESKGPAKVSTKSYRSGWDRIFGSREVVGQA